MIQNFMLFPFYESKDQQFRFRNYCANGEEVHSFRVPKYSLPSFFFKREKRPLGIGYFYVYDINDQLIATIDPLVYLHTVSTAEYDGFGYVQNRIENGSATFPDPQEGTSNYDNYTLPCGKYYIRLEESNAQKKYYSEVFEVVESEAITDGQELVLNGSLKSNLNNWTTDGSISIVAGFGAQYLGGATTSILNQILNPSSDGMHFYKVSFSINAWGGGPTEYIRVHFNGFDEANSVYVTGIGTYTGYFKNVSKIEVHYYNADVHFVISDISVQKIVGHENHIGLLSSRTCKYPNSINRAIHNYFNYFLLDAQILAPEYGEVIKEEENGDYEKVLSFSRPFKKHQLTPLLLPEPVADALAQLNTFDVVEIFDAFKKDSFILNSQDRLTKFRSIQQFETKIDWQEPNECYMLATVSFDENLTVFDKCCDDNEDAIECFEVGEGDGDSIVLSVTNAGDHFHIAKVSSIFALDAAFVTLYYKKESIRTYTDCESIAGANHQTGISMPWLEFVANGINYYAPDISTYAYSFFIVISQVGCPETVTSAAVCPLPCSRIASAEFSCLDGDPARWFIAVALDVSTCGETCFLEYYDTAIADWRPETESPTAIADGVHSHNTTFTTIEVPNPDTLTKIRLNFNSGAYYSNEVSFATLTPCP